MAWSCGTDWDAFHGKSPTAFLPAGLLLVGYAALKGIAAFTETAYPILANVVGPLGFLLGFLGLLGLYPALADRAPRLSRAGALCAGLGAVGFSVIAVANVGRFVGVVPESPPAWLPVAFAMVATGMIPGYLSFAGASNRADVGSTAFVALLLAPSAIFAAMLAGLVIGYTPAWRAFAISSGQALAHLAIGYAVSTVGTPPTSDVHASDVTAS